MRKLLLAILLVVASGGATAAWVQAATTNAEAVRNAILATSLWHDDRSNGTTTWHFELRGGKLWSSRQ